MASGVSSAQRSTQAAATLTCPPSNHVVHGTPADPSSTVVYGDENGRPRNSTAASQNHAGSSTERASRVSKSPMA
jgi:hypothetical protein